MISCSVGCLVLEACQDVLDGPAEESQFTAPLIQLGCKVSKGLLGVRVLMPHGVGGSQDLVEVISELDNAAVHPSDVLLQELA